MQTPTPTPTQHPKSLQLAIYWSHPAHTHTHTHTHMLPTQSDSTDNRTLALQCDQLLPTGQLQRVSNHWAHLIFLISLSNDNCWLSCLMVPVSHSGQEKDGQLHSTWYHLVDIHICPNRSFPLKDRSACSPFGHGCAWITDRRVTSTTHAHYQVPSLFNGLC